MKRQRNENRCGIVSGDFADRQPVRPTGRNQDRQSAGNSGATGTLRKVYLAPTYLLTPFSLLKNYCVERETPAKSQETIDFPRVLGSAGASPSLFQQAAMSEPISMTGFHWLCPCR